MAEVGEEEFSFKVNYKIWAEFGYIWEQKGSDRWRDITERGEGNMGLKCKILTF